MTRRASDRKGVRFRGAETGDLRLDVEVEIVRLERPHVEGGREHEGFPGPGGFRRARWGSHGRF